MLARAAPDTATHEFFVCVGDQPELDFDGKRNPDGQGFAVFGRVVRGMEVVRRIRCRRWQVSGWRPRSPSSACGVRRVVGQVGWKPAMRGRAPA